MKELDVLVTRYYERRYAGASELERAHFVRLLTEVEDPQIWSWSMGYAEPPQEFANVIAELRRHD